MVDGQQIEKWAEVADVDPDDVVDEVPAIADETNRESAEERNHAVVALSRVAKEHPEAVAAARPALVERLSDEVDTVRYNAALTLWRVASEHPGRLIGALPEIAGGLVDDASKVRDECEDALNAVADAYPDAVKEGVADFLADLVGDLTAADPDDRNAAARGFVRAASTAPGAVEESLDALTDCFDDESVPVRYHATMAVKRVATREPAAVTEFAGALASRLDDPDADVRELGAHALSGVADGDPDAVAPVAGALVGAVDDDHDDVTYYAAEALSAIAGARPGAVAPHASRLVSLLVDPAEGRTEPAARVLSTLADADPDPVEAALEEEGFAADRGIEAAITAAAEGGRATNGEEGGSAGRDDGEGDGDEGEASESGPGGVFEGGGRSGPVEGLVEAVNEVIEDDPDVGDVGGRPDYESAEQVTVDPGDDECAYAREVGISTWECPRDPMDGSDFCLFHAPVAEKDDAAVAEALLAAVTSEGLESKELVGARLGDFDLSYAILAADDNYPIDLRHAHVDGDLDAERLSVRQPLKATGLTVAGRADFEASTFEMLANFDRAAFGAVTFEGAAFEWEATFEGATFAGETSFDKATFAGDAEFDGAEFDRATGFRAVEVGGMLDMDDVTFEAGPNCLKARVDTLRLEGATVRGDLALDGVQVGRGIRLGDAEVEGDLSLGEASVGGTVSGEGVRVGGDLVLTSADVDDYLMLESGVVAGDVTLAGAEFTRLNVDDCTIGGDVGLRGVRSHSTSRVIDTDVGGDLLMPGAHFEGGFQAQEATVGGAFNGHGVRLLGTFICLDGAVEGETDFEHAVFERRASFKGTTFQGRASFEDASFRGDGIFDRTSFRREATFGGAEFAESLLLADAVFEGLADFGDATIADGQFDGTRADAGVIDLEGATLSGGSVTLPEETVVYDFADATVGDVELSFGSDGGDLPLFEHFRFLDTTFDGFDFGPYKDDLSKAGWRVHTTPEEYDLSGGLSDDFVASLAAADPDGLDLDDVASQVGVDRERVAELLAYDDPDAIRGETWLAEFDATAGSGRLTPGALENTYLRAKNGADRVGDRKAAAEFFIREMHNRRHKNWRLAREGDGLRERAAAAGKWFGNRLLHWTCGYGERLWRVVYVSVATIFVWGLFYAFLSRGARDTAAGVTVPGLEAPGQLLTREGLIILGKNLYFSVVTFTTLGYGDVQPVGPVARTLASTESFIGALLLALVVFVLGRRVAW
ncbi:MAG: pentapeptide repeat-containing protein [Haloarculaceae archaeon]